MTAGWVSSSSTVGAELAERQPGEDQPARQPRADDQPRRGAARGQPLPPDPEQEQRAERARRERERPADEHARCRARARAAPAGSAPACSPGRRRRKRRRRTSTAPEPLRQRSNDTVPATDTKRPDAVDMKAANAPAATSAPSSSPGQPRPRRLRQPQDHRVGLAGQVQLGHQRSPEQPVDGRERVEQRQQAEHAHGRAPRGRAVRVRVEADEDVRQAHRAQERRHQQRVDEHGGDGSVVR